MELSLERKESEGVVRWCVVMRHCDIETTFWYGYRQDADELIELLSGCILCDHEDLNPVE